ncbi:MAG: hypothetical protein FD159_946 [Syntrophaceae bacterium]|nr:MAG: hypothetical protein FD159_946 [Syntrophaceae bacterium]
MNTTTMIEAAGAERCAETLKSFLQSYLNPAFGALPKAEVELLVLRMLEDLGTVSPRPGAYELVSKLRITSSKARKLIYEQELRRTTPEQLDEQVRLALQHPIIQKDGGLFILEVENPLVSDHLRDKVKSLGYVSDGSFSPSIVKLSLDAIVALIESVYQTDKEKDNVRAALVAAGAPDDSFKGVLKAVLKKIGARVADETGEVLMGEASKYLEPIITGSVAGIKTIFKGILTDARQKRGR